MTTETNRPTHNVFAVNKKEGRDKAEWVEIGAAWSHKKGFNIVFKALPLPGAEVVVLERKDEPSGK
jgi:hypothetical protein